MRLVCTLLSFAIMAATSAQAQLFGDADCSALKLSRDSRALQLPLEIEPGLTALDEVVDCWNRRVTFVYRDARRPADVPSSWRADTTEDRARKTCVGAFATLVRKGWTFAHEYRFEGGSMETVVVRSCEGAR